MSSGSRHAWFPAGGGPQGGHFTRFAEKFGSFLTFTAEGGGTGWLAGRRALGAERPLELVGLLDEGGSRRGPFLPEAAHGRGLLQSRLRAFDVGTCRVICQ